MIRASYHNISSKLPCKHPSGTARYLDTVAHVWPAIPFYRNVPLRFSYYSVGILLRSVNTFKTLDKLSVHSLKLVVTRSEKRLWATLLIELHLLKCFSGYMFIENMLLTSSVQDVGSKF